MDNLRNLPDIDYHAKLKQFLDRVLPASGTCLYGNISCRIPTRWEHLFDILPYYKPPTLTQPALYVPPSLDAIIRKSLAVGDDSFYMELGGIPSGPYAAAGSWHRDSFPIFDEKTDSNLPTWYLTLVIPLIDDAEEQLRVEGGEGADIDFGGLRDLVGRTDRLRLLITPNTPHYIGTTSFIPGSHKKTMDELQKNSWNDDYAAVPARVRLGQAILFDGRTVHRGEANRTNNMRPFLYMVFNKPWYVDRELAFLPSLFDDGTHAHERAPAVQPDDPVPLKAVQTVRTWPVVNR